MGFPVSEAYSLPLNAKSTVGSVMANFCRSHYKLHMPMVEASSQEATTEKLSRYPSVYYWQNVVSLTPAA